MAADPARYFDPQPNDGTGDGAYVRVALRKWADLQVVAADVEGDVIRHFTRDLYRSGSGYLVLSSSGAARALAEFEEYTLLADGRRAVFLRGYTADAAACQDADLKVAMKRTCNFVLEWRKLTLDKDATADMESEAGKTVTKARNHQQPFPPGWKRYLRDWITLDPPGTVRI